MKHNYFTWVLGLLCLSSVGASATDVLMPQFGKQVIEVTSGEPLTFYDFQGTKDIASSYSSNSFATTVFKPTEANHGIQIVFSEVEVLNDGASYPAYLNIYDGIFDTTSVTYPTTTGGVGTTQFPSTDRLLAHLDGTYSDLSYLSTDPTGALSCCFHYNYAKRCKGWVATVASVALTEMEVKAAVADYSQIDAQIYPNKQAVALGAFGITTEGVTAAKKLESVSFSLQGTGVYTPADLKLYKGNAASVAGLQEVPATLTEAEGVYTLTPTDHTLATGDNTFCIGGNVSATAPFNATSTFTLTRVQAGGTVYPLAGTPAEQTVAAMVLMSNGNQQMHITQSTLLYDDGGPEGKISNNFEGSYTFLPTTEGKKVMLDMRNISIFYTPSAVSVGNQDILAIYDGTGVNADSLLYTVQADKLSSLILHSTAASGALTIYLRSKTPSDYYQGTGFEATLSEFVPQAMTIAASSVSKADTTPAACSTGVEALDFVLTTENTEPALAPVSFQFSTNGTYARIGKAYLYHGNKLVGETEVAANEVTITPSATFTLKEGENRFRVALDILCTAQTNESVEMNIQSVAFSDGTTYTAFQNPDGALTIKNIAYSECGEQTISVLGEWQFTHTVASEYSTKYKAEECNQTTTFLPTTEGHIIEMDFADFDVYYSSSSYGTKALFAIYAGSGTTGELLWQADADNKSKGPGKIRSTATDGALTIVFNPKASYSSSYTGNGWHAAVREYLPVPMVLGTATAALPENLPTLIRGLRQTPLMVMQLHTTGMLNPLSFAALSVTLAGGAEAVDSLFVMRGGEIIAKSKVSNAQTTLTLADCTLSEGDNTFVLTENIAEDAPFGTEVSVGALSARVGTADATMTVPENARPIRNIYCLETTHRRVEVGETPLTFYDAGGADGNLTAYAKGEVTFVPTVENTAIALRFKQWNINGADRFDIYYADTVQDKADLSPSYYTKDILDWYVVSEAESGAITVKYAGSYGSASQEGWEIEVSCHTLTPLVLDSVVVESASPGVVTKGSTDVPMLRVAVSVSGDRGNVQMQTFVPGNLPEGMTAKYYYTGTGSTFSSVTAFSADQPVTRKGTYYYWVALDIPGDQAEGTYELAVTDIRMDGAAVTVKRNTTAQLKVISGMHGTYRIGRSTDADFSTIQAAVDALKIGIDGAVTFQIEDGTYNECVRIPELMGLSEVNTLTIESLSGDTADVAIHYESYSPAYGEEYGVFNIQGADYVTLRNLTFYTDNTSFAGIVYVDNISQHVTVDNCHIYGPMVDSGTAKLRLVYTKALDEENKNNDCFTLSNSLLEGGYVGMYLGGTGYASLPKQIGGTIVGNTFVNQGTQSIYAPGESNITVRNNRITNNATTKADFRAMDLKLYDGGEISGNTIDLQLTNYAEAVYLRNVESTEDHPTRLFNNAVSVAADAASASKALVLTQSAKYLDIAHNTFYTSGNATTLLVQKVPTALRVRNNICYNAGGGLAFQVSGDWAANISFGTNLLYTTGATLARLSGTDMADLSAWKTTMSDDKAISEALTFRTNTLDPSEAGNLMCGEAIDYITTDIVGRTRGTLPTLGAYEYTEDPTTDLDSTTDRQPVRKILHNGTLVIISGDRMYNTLGQLIDTTNR